jgi:hypothetical protein
MPFDDEVAVERQTKHFAGELRGGRSDAQIAKAIVLYAVGGCSCLSLFGSDRCQACHAFYLLMGFVAAARADESNLDASPGKD